MFNGKFSARHLDYILLLCVKNRNSEQNYYQQIIVLACPFAVLRPIDSLEGQAIKQKERQYAGQLFVCIKVGTYHELLLERVVKNNINNCTL